MIYTYITYILYIYRYTHYVFGAQELPNTVPSNASRRRGKQKRDEATTGAWGGPLGQCGCLGVEHRGAHGDGLPPAHHQSRNHLEYCITMYQEPT